jgi:pimeloyl-ACP methyl ester carboxylesterase
VISEAELEMRLKPFRADFIGETRRLVAASMFTKSSDPAFVQKVAYDMSLEPQEIGIASMQSLVRLDLAPVVTATHVPVVAINSDRTPTDEARIRKSLPGFHAVVLENTGHFLMMEEPARFNPILLREIETIASAHRD